MNYVVKLLDCAVEACVPPTEYRLAQVIGCDQSVLTNIRKRKAAGAKMIIKLAEVCGEDAETILRRKYRVTAMEAR